MKSQTVLPTILILICSLSFFVFAPTLVSAQATETTLSLHETYSVPYYHVDETITSENDLLRGGCINSITVTIGADSGPGSLRDAVANICANGTINIDAGLTINLTSPIDFTNPGLVYIISTDDSVGSTINGGGTTRLFNVTNGAYPACFGINFTGGNNSAISVNGSAFYGFNCNFYNNSTTGTGGAIKSNNSQTFVRYASFYNNTASANAGAISTEGTTGVLETISTTFYNNSAGAGVGGAIASFGSGHDAAINFCTFTLNNAGNAGGAVYGESTIINTKSTIYYGNTAGNTAGNNLYIVGTLQSHGTNIFETAGGANVFNSLPSDIIGTDPVFDGGLVDPIAGSNLITKSLAIQPWGAAFNGAADCTEINGGGIGNGANGVVRPTNGACDIGAFEHRAITAACDDMVALTCGASVDDNTDNYLWLGCQSKRYSRLYEYTAEHSGDLNINMHSFSGDMDMSLYDDICNTTCTALVGSYSTSPTETINYSVTAGMTYYLLVYGYSNTQSSFALDVICPTPPAACDVPTNITCVAYSGNVARVTWTVANDANRYRLRYRTGGSAWTEVLTANIENFRYLNGLMPNTTYEYQMKTQCTGSNSVWSSTYTFTTLGSLCDKTTITSHNTSTSSANLYWTADADDVKYRLKYRPKSSAGSWVQIDNITNTQQYISNLVANTEYKVKIKVRCETGWTQWQTNYEFITDGSMPNVGTDIGNSNRFSNDVNVYPNPASDILNIDYQDKTVETMRIINSNGQVVLEKGTTQEVEQVSISDLPSGLYMVSIITSSQEIYTKQFVKK